VWKATVEVADDRVPPSPDAEAIRQSMHHPTLNLKADHTFELRIGFPTTGTWEQTGNQIKMTATNIAGTPATPGGSTGGSVAISPDLSGTLSDDKKSITISGDQTITFSK
jgi:hypothetical protein